MMKTTGALALLVVTLLFSASSAATKIVTVPVGNAGNAPDTRYSSGIGSVDYNYRIGKHEVTNAQYVVFLNSVDPTGSNALALYDANMSANARGGILFNSVAANGSKYEIKPGRDNNPVVFVNWFDSLRFVNWLHNGQGSGDTEDGAYTLLGGTPIPAPSTWDDITRNPGAKWWLPSFDEWYKAAYHKNDGVTGNYWDFPTSTDAFPYSDQPPGSDAPDPSNTANFIRFDPFVSDYNNGYAVHPLTPFDDAQNYLTDVGAYTHSTSPYGTFDQAGNVLELTDTVLNGLFFLYYGGSWQDSDINKFRALGVRNVIPTNLNTPGFDGAGFRVACLIPEPCTTYLAALGMAFAGWWRIRRQ